MPQKQITLHGDTVATMPTLQEGELAYAETGNELYIGTSSGNVLINPNVDVQGCQLVHFEQHSFTPDGNYIVVLPPGNPDSNVSRVLIDKENLHASVFFQGIMQRPDPAATTYLQGVEYPVNQIFDSLIAPIALAGYEISIPTDYISFASCLIGTLPFLATLRVDHLTNKLYCKYTEDVEPSSFCIFQSFAFNLSLKKL